ncbi:hypothetical protein JG687_00018161 [Phytophthora cactorum]|uniref:Ubiquitin-like protease family profile domain-containing protein n=1 Tax=Phytophthora cactorum TaxID=29920 RepID=A0A8T1TMD2_9STRA|nr:hypothetical protein JG687_00018161 [Phytophthora cactorum]
MPLADIKFNIHPVNLKSNHWGIILVRPIEVTRKRLRVHVFLYEPLIDDGYREDVETVWTGIEKNPNDDESQGKEGLRDFVERWLQATSPGFKLCIDAAYNFFTGYPELQHYNVSKANVKVMRLRMLWVIMHYFQEQCMSKDDADKTTKIHVQLQKELK